MRCLLGPACVGLVGALVAPIAFATPSIMLPARAQLHSGGELALRIAEGLARADTVTIDGGEYAYAEGPFDLYFTPHLTARRSGGQVLIRGRIDLRESVALVTYEPIFGAAGNFVDLVLRKTGWPRWTDAAPSLADARLEIEVRSTQPILVKGALADLSCKVGLALRGTVGAPTAAGEVSILPGGTINLPTSFRIPFENGPGHIRFAPGAPPQVTLAAEGIFVDHDDVSHTIRLRLSGPLTRLTASLSSPSLSDQNEVLALLITGQNPERLGETTFPPTAPAPNLRNLKLRMRKLFSIQMGDMRGFDLRLRKRFPRAFRHGVIPVPPGASPLGDYPSTSDPSPLGDFPLPGDTLQELPSDMLR